MKPRDPGSVVSEARWEGKSDPADWSKQAKQHDFQNLAHDTWTRQANAYWRRLQKRGKNL